MHENALNIADKWWYDCDKHWNLIQHWWQKLGIASPLHKPTRGLMGKWETVLEARKSFR